MSIIIVSMAPMGVVPLRMSKLAGEPPKMTGAAGRASWPMTRPDRLSATCWTSVPAIVTGEVAPVRPIEMSSEGMPARAAVDEALGGQVAPLEGRGGAGVEDRQGLPPERLGPAADGGQHLEHRPEALDAERPGHDGLGRILQPDEHPEAVGHGRGNVGGDDRRALEVDARAGVGDPGMLDEVPRSGVSSPAGVA